MPPTSKITTAVLDAALTERSGCVVEVADDLGISRNEVYRKCRIYGLEPESYREREVTFSSDGMSSEHERVSLRCNATRRVEDFGNTLGGMVEQAATVIADFGADLKARVGSGQKTKARLLSHQEKEQDAFRREMMACLNTDMTPSDVLQLLHKRYFPMMVRDFRLRHAQRQEEEEQ